MDPEERYSALESFDIDSRTNMIIMRWMSFLMDRIDIEAIPRLFSFYSRIGWIGEDIAEYLASVSQGTKKAEPEMAEAILDDEIIDHNLVVTKKRPGRKSSLDALALATEEKEWRLTPEDHMKSWMFVMELAGIDVDKNIWCEVQERIGRFETSLADYYRV